MARGKAAAFESRIAAGKMAPVSGRHVLVMLRRVTQFHADFGALACDAVAITHLTGKDFDDAAATVTPIVLRGCSIAGADPIKQA